MITHFKLDNKTKQIFLRQFVTVLKVNIKNQKKCKMPLDYL